MVLFRAPESFELLRRRRELAEVRALLVARERLLSDLRTQLISFEGRYLRQVGSLYRKLDEWEKKIAELHGTTEVQDVDEIELADEDDAPELDEFALRAIFRDLVKLIHPDLAKDEEDERRRTRLMSQANDAYTREDAAALKRMLNGYDPVVVLTSKEEVHEEVIRLTAMIFQMTQDVEAVDAQIQELRQSESAKLQERTLDAARQGRDLLAEMAARVNGSIGMAMRRYELDLSRIERPAKGPSVEELVTAETSRT